MYRVATNLIMTIRNYSNKKTNIIDYIFAVKSLCIASMYVFFVVGLWCIIDEFLNITNNNYLYSRIVAFTFVIENIVNSILKNRNYDEITILIILQYVRWLLVYISIIFILSPISYVYFLNKRRKPYLPSLFMRYE